MCVSAKSLVLEMQKVTLHKIQEHMLEEGRRFKFYFNPQMADAE